MVESDATPRHREPLLNKVAGSHEFLNYYIQHGTEHQKVFAKPTAAALLASRLKPGNKEAAYNLARALDKTAPEEARTLRRSVTGDQKRQMAIEPASTLGNFALSSASERDWPRAVAQLKEALEICDACSLQPSCEGIWGSLTRAPRDPGGPGISARRRAVGLRDSWHAHASYLSVPLGSPTMCCHRSSGNRCGSSHLPPRRSAG